MDTIIKWSRFLNESCFGFCQNWSKKLIDKDDVHVKHSTDSEGLHYIKCNYEFEKSKTDLERLLKVYYLNRQ